MTPRVPSPTCLRSIVCLVATAFAWGCGSSEPPSFERKLTSPELLESHSAEFRREVIEVAPGIHVAVGYGLANSILLIGDGGAVVVDTMESLEAADEVLAEFRKITDLPIEALIYTHNHADHVFGAGAFEKENDGEAPDVYAHRTTAALIDRLVNVVRPVITRRGLRMFGNFLDQDARVNCGIGSELRVGGEYTVGVLRPSHLVDDRLEVEIAGLRLELVHAPGETDDQIFVWLPEQRALLPGDNFYRAFPNLYTIRGTPYRDPMQWVRSLDAMRARRPEHLIPSHSRPISGSGEIGRVLTTYRDAIQYVHDQTVRGMNAGLGPDELAHRIRLPAHLSRSPYLQELYGKVSWSVRSIFAGYMGWFDGNPSRLDPHPPVEKAERMAELAGGVEGLRAAADRAEQAADWPWVLELGDHLLLLDPEDEQARMQRVRALEAMGEAEGNPNGRHTYLTRALELGRGLDPYQDVGIRSEQLHAIPTASFFASLAVNLDPLASAELDQKVAFHFTDTGERFTIHVRRGVAEIIEGPTEKHHLVITMDSAVFKDMLAKKRNALTTLLGPEIDLIGSRTKLVSFFRLFEAVELEQGGV